MAHFILIIIYLAFISLGLPDALLGSAWPIMQVEMDVPLSYAGIVSMIISAGTIYSSLMSDKLTRKVSSGLITSVSVLLTAVALFGFSISNSFILLCIFAIPYGLGAGAVDATINNYAAIHYSSRHMSWLHACWGVGAAVGPVVMGYFLTNHDSWSSGYLSIAILQIVLTGILFMSLPKWVKREDVVDAHNDEMLSLRDVLKIKGVKYVLATFFGYCSLEATAGLWATSYLFEHHSLDAKTAANCAALFYVGITGGRFVSGIIAEKLGDVLLLRGGLAVMVIGILMLPRHYMSAIVGLVVLGIGCAPIYPTLIHATPSNFGAKYSGSIIGIQMAFAYIGITVMPPIFGFLADNISIALYPVYMFSFVVLMFAMTELLNKFITARKKLA